MNPSPFFNERLLVAWNAAYWLMRSEARRQQKARYPDCNWKHLESDEDWAGEVAMAQAELCLKAMPRVKSSGQLCL